MVNMNICKNKPKNELFCPMLMLSKMVFRSLHLTLNTQHRLAQLLLTALRNTWGMIES